MKKVSRTALFVSLTLVTVVICFIIVNEIDENSTVQLPPLPLQTDAEASQNFRDFLGIASPADTDWKADGAHSHQLMAEGKGFQLEPLPNTKENFGALFLPKERDAKYVHEHDDEIRRFLAVSEPALSRVEEIAAKGKLANDLPPSLSKRTQSMALRRMTQLEELKIDYEIAHGERKLALKQELALWNLDRSTLDNYAPLIDEMIALANLKSIQTQVTQIEKRDPEFKKMVEAAGADKFVAHLDADQIFDRARIWEMYWVRDVLQHIDQVRDITDITENPVVNHLLSRSQNRVLNGLNESWLAAAKMQNYEAPIGLRVYPAADWAVRVFSSNIVNSRRKMNESIQELAATPLN